MLKGEALEQIAVCQYLDLLRIPYYAVPNGGSRNPIEAANLRLQGVKRGVPDLVVTVPKNGYHGLYIELKHGKNKPSTEQVAWKNELIKNGYFSAICYEFEGAKKVIDAYFKEQK